MKVTRMSDGAVLEAILEDRGCIVPGFDKDNRPFPAWTAYFECGEIACYTQLDLRLTRKGHASDMALDSLRSMLRDVGFEARDEDLPVPNIPPPHLLRGEGQNGPVEVAWRSYGDIIPGYGAGMAPFPAVTSCFEFGGEMAWCVTKKQAGVDPFLRHKDDCVAMLAELGLRVRTEALG